MREISYIGEMAANKLVKKTGMPFMFDYEHIDGAILPVIKWQDTDKKGTFYAIPIHEVYGAAERAELTDEKLIEEIESVVFNFIKNNSEEKNNEQNETNIPENAKNIVFDIASLKNNPEVATKAAFCLIKGDLCVFASFKNEDGSKKIITKENLTEMGIDPNELQFYTYYNTFQNAQIDFKNVFENEFMRIFVLREDNNKSGSCAIAAPNFCNCLYHVAGSSSFVFPVSKDFTIVISVQNIRTDSLEHVLKPVVESYIKDIPDDRFLTRDIFVQYVESPDMIGDFIPLEAYLDIINGR